MSSAVNLPNHMFTGQALSSKRLTSIVHILPPETDNCPSWISGRERMTVENISWSISTKECCRPRRGSNLRPHGLQSDVHPTEPPRPASLDLISLYNGFLWYINDRHSNSICARSSSLRPQYMYLYFCTCCTKSGFTEFMTVCLKYICTC